MATEQNPERYADLQRRHKTAEEAKLAAAAFAEEVQTLRIKHGICDVVLVAIASVLEQPTQGSTIMLAMGSDRVAARLVAQAFASLVQPRITEAEQLMAVAGGQPAPTSPVAAPVPAPHAAEDKSAQGDRHE